MHGKIDAYFRGQSCIRELDGILPHFGLEKSSDASLVDGTLPAVSASATSLAYSPEGRRSHELQYDRIEDPSVAPMLGGLVQDGDAAHMPHRMLEGSGATMSPGARTRVPIPPHSPPHSFSLHPASQRNHFSLVDVACAPRTQTRKSTS